MLSFYKPCQAPDRQSRSGFMTYLLLFFYNIIEQKFRVLIAVCRQKYHFEN